MALPLPQGRVDYRQGYSSVQQQQQRGSGHAVNAPATSSATATGSGDNGGSGRNRQPSIMRAVSQSTSVAVSDAILAAQCAFEGGDFQPEAFPRCLCYLLEAFEGGDNATKLCAARLLERCRPYFGSTILAIEIAHRVSHLLDHHHDPTTRELCLDVLAAVAFGAGGLPRGILDLIGRSLRSPFLAERQAAARAYATCICIHRSSSSLGASAPASAPGGGGGGGVSYAEIAFKPRTLEDMMALSSALLPMLVWGQGGGRVSALAQPTVEVGAGVMEPSVWLGDGGGGISTGSESGAISGGAERLLEAVLCKVSGDLPSTELWESFKVFLLDEGEKTSSFSPSPPSAGLTKRGPNVTALVDLMLNHLRSNGKPVLRAIAVDFFVSLIHVEATERSKFAMAAAEAAVEAAAAADAAAAGGEADAATDAASETASVSSAPTPGRTAVWCLLGTLSASDNQAEKAELLSVLGAPALAVAVLDAEAVAGTESEDIAAADGSEDSSSDSSSSSSSGSGSRKGGGSSKGGGSGRVSNALARAREWFPLATAAVETFRQLSACPSSSSSVLLACASSLVSYSVAAFRDTPLYPPEGCISRTAEPRDKAMSGLAELAVEGVVSSPLLLRMFSASSGDGEAAAAARARLLFPQLRTLAAVHAWPCRKVGVAVVSCLAGAPARSPLATDLAVLVSHIARRSGGSAEAGPCDVDGDEVEKLLWELLFGRRFCKDNPKAAVGIAVALMRHHRGSFRRQATLSAALVGAMGGGEKDVKAIAPEGSEPIVLDPWFQLVLCRECMLHGFYGAAEAGLRRLRGGGGVGRGEGGEEGGLVVTSDAVGVWMEVLERISAAEAFFGGSSDPVAANACAAHETALAAEVLSSLPRRVRSETGRSSPPPQRQSHQHQHQHQHPQRPSSAGLGVVEGYGAGHGVARVLFSTGGPGGAGGGGSGGLFAFQRLFLQARTELVKLLGGCWSMCQDLSATRTSRYARFSRREARCKRLPAAFRRLAGDFRTLRGLAPGAGATTMEPLRAASCLCLFLAIAADTLLSFGKKSVFAGSRDKNAPKKKTWKGWLERLAAGGSGVGGGQDEAWEAGDDPIEASGDGALMKAVRLLGARLLSLPDTPKAPIGRVAFSSILESVRGTPFPIPRAFFRTGVTPRVAVAVLPPAPVSVSAMTGASTSAMAMDDTVGDEKESGGAASVGEKRQRRDGGIGARYYGPSCRLRDDTVEAELSRRPRLPLMASGLAACSGGSGGGGNNLTAGDDIPPSSSSSSRNDGGAGSRRDLYPLPFSASETWWAQTAREELMFAVSSPMGVGNGGVVTGGMGAMVGGNNCGWRAHALAQMGSPGVWLLQGTVCRGRGTGGALPGISQVILKISARIPTPATGGGGVEGVTGEAHGSGATIQTTSATRHWSKQVVAEVFGAAADSRTAICFRSQVHLPPLVLSTVHNAAAAVATGAPASAGGNVLKVVVSLRSRCKQQQHDEMATSTGFTALASAPGTPHGIGSGDGDREAWVVGTVFIPLPSLLMTPAW